MSSFGHSVLANERALKLGHVEAGSRDPSAARFNKVTGQPSGILEDAACNMVMKLSPRRPRKRTSPPLAPPWTRFANRASPRFLDADAENVDIESFTKVQQSGGLTARGHFAVPIRPAADLDPDKAVAAVKAIADQIRSGPGQRLRPPSPSTTRSCSWTV